MINTALAHDGEKTEREGKGGREVEMSSCVPRVTYANATTLIQKERQETRKKKGAEEQQSPPVSLSSSSCFASFGLSLRLLAADLLDQSIN